MSPMARAAREFLVLAAAAVAGYFCSMARLLIVKTGSTVEPVFRRRGDFEQWFAHGLGLTMEQVELVDVQRGETLPAPDHPRGIVVTGSPEMVSERAPWSERTAAWLPSVVRAGTPLLAVCYGHQLLAHALGGQVGPNPRGLEMGTVSTRLTPAAAQDPLFSGLPPQLVVQATHYESVLSLPPGARCLAASEGDPCHAFAVGRAAWGLQFHPEFDAEIVRGYLEERRQWVIGHGRDPDALTMAARDSDHGAQLLRSFAKLILE